MMEWINSLTENEANGLIALCFLVAFVSGVSLLPDFKWDDEDD
jgi:hypothetical protein